MSTKMLKGDLVAVAEKHGIQGAKDLTVTQLKAIVAAMGTECAATKPASKTGSASKRKMAGGRRLSAVKSRVNAAKKLSTSPQSTTVCARKTINNKKRSACQNAWNQKVSDQSNKTCPDAKSATKASHEIAGQFSCAAVSAPAAAQKAPKAVAVAAAAAAKPVTRKQSASKTATKKRAASKSPKRSSTSASKKRVTKKQPTPAKAACALKKIENPKRSVCQNKWNQLVSDQSRKSCPDTKSATKASHEVVGEFQCGGAKRVTAAAATAARKAAPQQRKSAGAKKVSAVRKAVAAAVKVAEKTEAATCSRKDVFHPERSECQNEWAQYVSDKSRSTCPKTRSAAVSAAELREKSPFVCSADREAVGAGASAAVAAAASSAAQSFLSSVGTKTAPVVGGAFLSTVPVPVDAGTCGDLKVRRRRRSACQNQWNTQIARESCGTGFSATESAEELADTKPFVCTAELSKNDYFAGAASGGKPLRLPELILIAKTQSDIENPESKTVNVLKNRISLSTLANYFQQFAKSEPRVVSQPVTPTAVPPKAVLPTFSAVAPSTTVLPSSSAAVLPPSPAPSTLSGSLLNANVARAAAAAPAKSTTLPPPPPPMAPQPTTATMPAPVRPVVATTAKPLPPLPTQGGKVTTPAAAKPATTAVPVAVAAAATAATTATPAVVTTAAAPAQASTPAQTRTPVQNSAAKRAADDNNWMRLNAYCAQLQNLTDKMVDSAVQKGISGWTVKEVNDYAAARRVVDEITALPDSSRNQFAAQLLAARATMADIDKPGKWKLGDQNKDLIVEATILAQNLAKDYEKELIAVKKTLKTVEEAGWIEKCALLRAAIKARRSA